VNASITINGVRIDASTDIVSLVRDQLLGSGLLSGRYDEGPEAGVRSLVEVATGTAIEGRVLTALRSLLADSDSQVRAGAVGVVLHFAEKFDPSDLLETLKRNRALYDNVPLSPQGKSGLDLSWALMRAMAARPSRDPAVLQTLREALREPNGSWLLAGVANNDADWLVEHPQEALDDDPERARIVLFRLSDKNLRERFVRAIPTESPSLRKAVADAVASEIKDPVERNQLLRLLR
jgi:hypothetical protein